MSVSVIEDLRAWRKGLLDEMLELQSAAEAADRDLSAEEAQEFERREADFDSISGRIDRLEKLEGLASDSQRENPAVVDTDEEKAISADPAEVREIERRAFERHRIVDRRGGREADRHGVRQLKRSGLSERFGGKRRLPQP